MMEQPPAVKTAIDKHYLGLMFEMILTCMVARQGKCLSQLFTDTLVAYPSCVSANHRQIGAQTRML
jgi:hypothetical protein